MCVPIVFCRQCLIDAVVKVFVVGEDDVTANVVELDSFSIRIPCSYLRLCSQILQV